MNEPNPYASPATPVADVGAPHPSLRPQRITFAMLVALQFLGTLVYAKLYFMLANTGVVSVLPFLGAAIGNACMYVATLIVLFGRARGFWAFVLAAIFLASSLLGWGLAHVWSWVIAFGALLAVYGAVLVRAMKVRS